jgi:hypothetical protein
MTREEFNRVTGLVKSFWPREQFFSTKDGIDTFFNILNRYDYRDISSALSTLVEISQFAPSMAEIVHAVEKAGKDRRDAERQQQNARQAWNNAVACTKCNDSGFQFVTYEDGTEVVRPCTCQKARDRYKWAFMDDDEWKTFVDERRRKGQTQSYDRPGRPTAFFEEHCGSVISIRPGGSAKNEGKRKWQ